MRFVALGIAGRLRSSLLSRKQYRRQRQSTPARRFTSSGSGIRIALSEIAGGNKLFNARQVADRSYGLSMSDLPADGKSAQATRSCADAVKRTWSGPLQKARSCEHLLQRNVNAMLAKLASPRLTFLNKARTKLAISVV